MKINNLWNKEYLQDEKNKKDDLNDGESSSVMSEDKDKENGNGKTLHCNVSKYDK